MKQFKFAVIGKAVSQSSSPRMHTFIAKKLGAELEYDNISVPPEEISAGAGGFPVRLRSGAIFSPGARPPHSGFGRGCPRIFW